MFPMRNVKPGLLDVYLNQMTPQVVDRAVSDAEGTHGSILSLDTGTESKNTHRSILSMDTGTEAENITLELKEPSKDEEDALEKATTKPNILAIYMAHMNQIDNNIDKEETKGKKVDLKPDCGSLADGIKTVSTDDEDSKIYDDLLIQLGLQREIPGCPDHLNPFKLGYLKATPPPPVVTSRFRRILRSVRETLARIFGMCGGCCRSTEGEEKID